jgi:acetyl-CoA C-acetyltransferase
MLDCSPISDGGAALVLTTLERAREMSDSPVVISGSAQASDTLALHDRWSLTSQRATRTAAGTALAQAGRAIEDMDLLEVNDGFTIGEIIALEDLGMAEPGQGGRLAEEGVTALGGETPVNTSGGLKARGNPPGATGIAQAVEVYDQLVGRASGRQVEDARIGLAQNVGGTGATVTVHVLEVA